LHRRPQRGLSGDMDSLDLPHAPITSHHCGADQGSGDLAANAYGGAAAAAFLTEIATLEALDDDTFAGVVPATRPEIVARVVPRGRPGE
jgi:hypothetical protein